jgi:hypothetical protein
MPGTSRTGTARALLALAAGALLGTPAIVFAGEESHNLRTNLKGKNVVPEGDGAPNGSGSGVFKIRPEQGEFCVEMEWRRTGGPVRGFIFRGRKGEQPKNPNKPSLTLFNNSQSSPIDKCKTGIVRKKLRRMADRPHKFHVVLVNSAYPNGAVRGDFKRNN